MAVLGIFVGITILVRQRRAHHGLLASPYLPGREPAAEVPAEVPAEAATEQETADAEAGHHESVALESDKPESN